MKALLLYWRFISWLYRALKVGRSDYINGLKLIDRYWKLDRWHHPTHGYAQMSPIHRWWYIRVIPWLQYHVGEWSKMNATEWLIDDPGQQPVELIRVKAPYIGIVDIQQGVCVDLYITEFSIFGYQFKLECGELASFPHGPVLSRAGGTA